MAIETDLTQSSVSKQLISYAMPLVASSMLQSVYSITDTIIAGHYIGNAGLSAINNGSLVMNLITQIAIGITVGGNVLIGQYFGGGAAEKRREAAGCLFVLCLLLGAATSTIFMAFSRPILVLLRAPALDGAMAYLRICAMGLLPIFGYNGLSAIFRAMGNSRRPMYCILCATVINVALDILFVVGFDWGVEGAALATLLAQMVSFLLALVMALCNRRELGLCRGYLRLRMGTVRQILTFGLPIALQWTIASISWMVVTSLINHYGVDPSAGNGVSNKIKDLCQMFISAMTSGAATMIAQNLGAGRYDRAREVMHSCMRISLVMAFCLIVIAWLFGLQMVSIFTNESEVQRWAVLNLRIEIFAQAFYAGFLTYNTLATGCGDTVFVMWNSFVNCIVVRLVLAVILEHFYRIIGVYVACAVAPASSVPIGWWYYRSGKWQKNVLKTEHCPRGGAGEA